MGTKIEKITLGNGLEFNWNDFTGGTYVDYNGIYLTDIEKGFVRGEIELKPHLLNPLGVLHGGVIVTLADTIAIMGCGYLYEAVNVTTTNLNVQYLKPAKTGIVHAEGKVLSKGKSVSSWQVDLYDEEKKHIAVVQVSFFIAG